MTNSLQRENLSDRFGKVVAADADVTLQRNFQAEPEATNESCLVQIYPADVVDGMFLLEDDRVQFGRDGRSEVPLDDGSVSRRHAEICKENGQYVIRDLGSTNGTLVNGEIIESRILSSGDTIGIGSFLFKYLSAGSVESQYHETVYAAMTQDALTGTLNKRYLLESMEREIARAMRQQAVLSVAMMDIDHFKSVNDTHGHLVGDEVLREFGKRLSSVCRADDMLARYGGEEFCLLMTATPIEQAVVLAERCREIIAAEPFPTSNGPLSITASFGVAALELGSDTSSNELIESADRKLYEAKKAGRNRVCS